MPYKSDAQRRFFHTDTAKKAGITDAEVKEFDKASKGKELPEHTKHMADGGLIDLVKKFTESQQTLSNIEQQKKQEQTADNIDPVVTSSGTVQGHADGGVIDKDEPGVKDATVSDFLLPFMLGKSTSMAEELGPKLADEAGSITIGRAAPTMEAAENPNEVTAFVKGIQKGAPGTEGVKIYGVKGSPARLKELFGDEAPGSVPESVLREKGILPSSSIQVPGQNAPAPYAQGGYATKNEPSNTTPTPFAEGGKVERSSLAHPVPNGMMARAMNAGGFPHVTDLKTESFPRIKQDVHLAKEASKTLGNGATGHKENYAEGGYPHVTFLENESPKTVQDTVHLEPRRPMPTTSTETGEKENPTHMAKGGVAPGGDVHVNRESHMSVPIVSKDTEFHLKRTPEEMAKDDVGDTVKVALPATVTSKEGDMERVKTHGDAEVQKGNKPPMPITMSNGGKTPENLVAALKRTKEPVKPSLEPPHEAKLKAIYKAMGIKGYADGGEVDLSQPPWTPASSATPPTPSPSDPGFWDSIKSALAQVGKPIVGAANLTAAPAQAITPIAQGLAPAATGAVNNLLGTSLPIPASPAAPAPNLPPPAAPTAPVVAPKPVLPGPAAPVGSNPASGVDLKNLFNQDTSKLTAGVNPEDRMALVNQLQSNQHSMGSLLGEAISGLGDALAAKGGREQHSLQNIFNMQKDQRTEALANFDKARQDRLEKLDLQTKMGNNAIQGLAAQDAYGTDEHLNKMLGAPPGTAHKDLGLYFQAKAAAVAQQEKDADLYMKAHAQAGADVDNAIKNSSVLGIKPSPAQIQASGQKLADVLYNRAKGNLQVRPSDGGPAQWIPAANLHLAKQMDPNLQVVQ